MHQLRPGLVKTAIGLSLSVLTKFVSLVHHFELLTWFIWLFMDVISSCLLVVVV